MAEPAHAVFLSYASQDADAAQKMCEALRAAGIKVFLDQSELRGGDVWDQKIRHEIHDCALFVPIISQHTQVRLEGYFRREWKLAIDRTHDIAEQKPFLVPVVVDGTRDQEAFVPDAFRAVQWTHLPGGDTPPAFVERIKRLLSPDLSPLSAVSGAAHGISSPGRASRRSKPVLLAAAALMVLGVLAYVVADRHRIPNHPVVATIAFAPPPHSIAVLPFLNMSADKEQEYFSDGLTEELLNSLAQINELQVAARTSVFSFKGTNTDIGTIARKLNVGAVLEGSVRRSGNTVRVTTELINAVTGFHLWSHSYDRELGDVLKLETEIASAVAGALKVRLLGDEATKIELGGTRNPAAFDAYLQGRKMPVSAHSEEDDQTAIAAYTEAIKVDPDYALAFASRSMALTAYAGITSASTNREHYDSALSDARKAIALAPDLAEGHVALAYYFETGALDFARANNEYERALALAPGNAEVLRRYGQFAVRMGRAESGIAAARRAVVLDPLSHSAHNALGAALFLTRQHTEAIAAYQHGIALDPEDLDNLVYQGIAYYALGEFERAYTTCASRANYGGGQICLALTDDKLGRHADAQSMLAKFQASAHDSAAYQYAEIYAQWGNAPKALEWLDVAMRLRDPGLVDLKTDPLMDPLRKEPRFQAALQQLRFPD